MPRYVIHRKDRNHKSLVELAERLGMTWYQFGPLDGWLFNPRTKQWLPVEIKDPDKEGYSDEFTPAQRKFINWAKSDSAQWLVWRTEADVIAAFEGA